jgi:hypothetical protein
MALGFGSKKADTASVNPNATITTGEEYRDPEKGSYDGSDKNGKGGRLGGPVRGDLVDSDGEASLDIDKQIALEADNDIKYRTCSWQKVCLPIVLCAFMRPVTNCVVDCSVVVLRVHLLGYYVIPVVVLHPRPRARLDPNRRDCGYSAVHLATLLVSPSFVRR